MDNVTLGMARRMQMSGSHFESRNTGFASLGYMASYFNTGCKGKITVANDQGSRPRFKQVNHSSERLWSSTGKTILDKLSFGSLDVR